MVSSITSLLLTYPSKDSTTFVPAGLNFTALILSNYLAVEGSLEVKYCAHLNSPSDLFINPASGADF